LQFTVNYHTICGSDEGSRRYGLSRKVGAYRNLSSK
jgi:hypothetical protein